MLIKRLLLNKFNIITIIIIVVIINMIIFINLV